MKSKNNISLDNIIINDEVIFLENQEITKITVSGDSTLNMLNCNIINLDVSVSDNSSLVINYFNEINNLDSTININTNYKSEVTFNHSYINKKDYNLKINTNFLSNDSTINVNVNGINDKGHSIIDVSGYVKINKDNNVLNESIREINISGGTCLNFPKMYIDNLNVSASHNNTIGSISKEELNYLMSKGLSKEDATKLIINGFIISNINSNELKIKIKELLSRR